jgi:hypothetical protein
MLECSASQEERVDMLNTALIEKGVVTSTSHYELRQAPVADAQQQPAAQLDALMGEADEGGVVL